MTKTTFHCFRKNLAANRVGGNCQIGADKMVRHVMGRIHQGIEKFCPFNGLQCTAIAFLALVVLSGMSRDRPQTWVNDVTSSDIDNLVNEGTSLYAYIARVRGVSGYLTHNDLPRSLRDWMPHSMHSPDYEIQTDIFFGRVGGNNEFEFGQNTLENSMYQASIISPYLMFTARGLTISVICDLENDRYAIFDSHQRNEDGLLDESGNAILLYFDSIHSILDFLNRDYGGFSYELSPVIFNYEVHQQPEPHFFHSYAKQTEKSFKLKKSTIRKRKRTSQDEMFVSTCAETFPIISDHADVANENNTINGFNMTNVGYTCTVETLEPSVEFLNCDFHNSEYELHIRQKPSSYCRCCDRILFPDQIVNLKQITATAEMLNLSYDDVLCRYCHGRIKQNKMCPLSTKLNNLDNGRVPTELRKLSLLEKRMISLIQVFLSIHILPGGQYAEKGLVLNLPMNVQEIANQLPRNFEENATLSVHFLHSEPAVTNKHFISCKNLKDALTWLIENNPLYKEIKLEQSIDILSDLNNELLNGYESSSHLDSNFNYSSLTPLDVNTPILNASSFLREGVIKVSSSTHQPVNIFDLTSGEEMAFPWLFPFGVNGLRHNRDIHVNPSMYFKYRLYNRHAEFRYNLTYLLHSCVSYNVSLLKSEIGVHMRMCKSRDDRFTAADIRHSSQASDVLENSYMFMKNIKGTIAYFKNALYNLLSMVRCLGPPTIFLTLSADDNHWTELGMCLKNLTYEEAFRRESFSSFMKDDPLMTALCFNRRFKYLLNDVILGKDQPFGQIQDYFGRIEFQNRGSPHMHMFLWVKDFPTEVTENNKQFFVRYIDKTIHANIPINDSELCKYVTKFQTHSHTTYCQNRQTRCRFHFPHPVSPDTKIVQNIDMSKSNKGKFYVLKRNKQSTMINPYNPVILRHWRANIDVQLVCNAEGVAYYVCSYLCKSEPEDLRSALGNLILNVFKQNPDLEKHKKLLQIGLCVLKHRRLSSQEAAYRLGDLNLLHTSRSFVNLNTRLPEKRFRLLKGAQEIASLENNSTDIFHSNMLDYYQNRPLSIEAMSYFKFASLYVKAQPLKEHSRCNASERIYIQKYDLYMRPKKIPNIVRFTNLPIHSDDYFNSLLLMLLPHRDEKELTCNFPCAKEAFVAKRHLLNVSVPYEKFSFVEKIETIMRRIQMCEQELENSQFDLHFQETNDRVQSFENLYSNEISEVSHVTQTDSSAISYLPFTSQEQLHMHSLQCSMSFVEYEACVSKLSETQLFSLGIIKNHFQTNQKNSFHLFITGGAGTGKSFLSKVIIAYLELYTSRISGAKPVLVCAPTGTAANVIAGQTIHSAFMIPVSNYGEYQPLSPFCLSKLRNMYVTIHTLIIDEISMVSSSMLTYISRRLSDIKQCELPFGGLNVIAIGDFFQLRPVKASFVFENTILWELFKPIFLKENMRQRDDNLYASLLNRARVGMLTNNDISILKKRLINPNASGYETALRVFPTRAKVNSYNEYRQNLLSNNLETLHATHYFASNDPNAGNDVPNSFIPQDDNAAGGLPSCVQLSIKSRVMLIRNLNTQNGLVNGAMGYVESFTRSLSGKIVSVNVLFDNQINDRRNATQELSQRNNAIPIEQLHHQFIIHGRHIVRVQFPLILCYACTIHKVQGMSLDKICVDIGPDVFERGMAYVALSRVKCLDGLGIISFDPKVVLPYDKVLEEYDRLRKFSYRK